jgi:hypothetical protein
LDLKDPYERLWTPTVDWERDANPGPITARINEQIPKHPKSAASLASVLIVLGLDQRDVTIASRAVTMLPLENIPGNDNERYPRAYYSALVAGLANQPALAREEFAAARVLASAQVAARPNDAKAMAVLALIDAGLGQKEEAMKEARRACELLPLSRDALDGSFVKQFFVQVAAQTGEREVALSELETLARIPSPVNYGDLKLNPIWDSLRQEPRFTALLAELAPPTEKSNR